MPTIGVNKELENLKNRFIRIDALLSNDESVFIAGSNTDNVHSLANTNFMWRLPNEEITDFNNRKPIFARGFINPAQELITASGDMLFKQNIRQESGNTIMSDFLDNVTQGGDITPMKQFMRERVAVDLRAYGNSVTIVDKPRTDVMNRAEERKEGLPYITNIPMSNVLNWEFMNGELIWFAYKRLWTNIWLDPLGDKPQEETQTVIWTTTEMIVLDGKGDQNSGLSFTHNWGIVPVVWQTTFLANDSLTVGDAAFTMSSNYIITANNLKHMGLLELRKHGGSKLLMHIDAFNAMNNEVDDEGKARLKTHDNNNMLPWDGVNIPEYLVKDLSSVAESKAMSEDYFMAAADNERDLKSVTRKSPGGGSETSIAISGISKMLDRDPIVSNLASLAADLHSWYAKTMDVVSKILNVNDDTVFEFDTEFDLKPISQKIDEVKKAEETQLFKASPTARKTMYKDLTGNITDDKDTMTKMQDEIDASDFDEAELDMSDAIDKDIMPTNFGSNAE